MLVCENPKSQIQTQIFRNKTLCTHLLRVLIIIETTLRKCSQIQIGFIAKVWHMILHTSYIPLTSTVNLQNALLPLWSVNVYCTVVSPTGKKVPDWWLCETTGWAPSLSVAVMGFHVTISPKFPAAVMTVMGAEGQPVMTGGNVSSVPTKTIHKMEGRDMVVMLLVYNCYLSLWCDMRRAIHKAYVEYGNRDELISRC